jgi:hypothetical protein
VKCKNCGHEKSTHGRLGCLEITMPGFWAFIFGATPIFCDCPGFASAPKDGREGR